MNRVGVTRATLGRLPMYLKYLRTLPHGNNEHISSAAIADNLSLGDVQVRKDLNSVSGGGKPKTGYIISELINCLENYLKSNSECSMVIVGAGKLGKALMSYDSFEDFGLKIAAAFDCDESKAGFSESGKPIYPMKNFDSFCGEHDIKIGIITVPSDSAQQVCDRMIENNISAIWNFAQCNLCVPANVLVKQENIALSAAHLNNQLNAVLKNGQEDIQ